MATKFPTTVIVLCMISNEGDVMPPHIIAKKLEINTEEFLNSILHCRKCGVVYTTHVFPALHFLCFSLPM
jgi:hypothetical protein